jgi:hypothetical protein
MPSSFLPNLKDELKLSFARRRSKERRSHFADKAGTALLLTRDKKAKVPDLVTPATVVQPVRLRGLAPCVDAH